MKKFSPRKSPFAISVRKRTSGFGLVAEQAIPRRRFVMEYFGKLVTDDEANRIGGKYLFNLGNGRTIDGTLRKNIARYINHSCRPNCEVVTRGNRVFVMSRKAIKPGEELAYDYGKEYFDYFIGKHCRCVKCTEKKEKRA